MPPCHSPRRPAVSHPLAAATATGHASRARLKPLALWRCLRYACASCAPLAPTDQLIDLRCLHVVRHNARPQLVLGSINLMDHLVIFDRVRGRVGFQPTDCSSYEPPAETEKPTPSTQSKPIYASTSNTRVLPPSTEQLASSTQPQAPPRMIPADGPVAVGVEACVDVRAGMVNELRGNSIHAAPPIDRPSAAGRWSRWIAALLRTHAPQILLALMPHAPAADLVSGITYAENADAIAYDAVGRSAPNQVARAPASFLATSTRSFAAASAVADTNMAPPMTANTLASVPLAIIQPSPGCYWCAAFSPLAIFLLLMGALLVAVSRRRAASDRSAAWNSSDCNCWWWCRWYRDCYEALCSSLPMERCLRSIAPPTHVGALARASSGGRGGLLSVLPFLSWQHERRAESGGIDCPSEEEDEDASSVTGSDHWLLHDADRAGEPVGAFRVERQVHV